MAYTLDGRYESDLKVEVVSRWTPITGNTLRLAASTKAQRAKVKSY